MNACLLLEHSTICPFRDHHGFFHCLYCKNQYGNFEDLRQHNQESHSNLTLKTLLKHVLRPKVKVKVDVSDITCKICATKLETIVHLVDHLTEKHEIEFNYDVDLKPKECVTGYELKDGKYKCAVCKKEYAFFKTLNVHMNEHSSDYVCDVCGRCFLSSIRLRTHRQLHESNAAAKCHVCLKLFTSTLALNNHIRYVHMKRAYVCGVCNLTFPTFTERVDHAVEKHGRVRPNLTCEICAKSFSTTSSLKMHNKLVHLGIFKDPEFSCSYCGKLFDYKNKLESHILSHTGEKNQQCAVCQKRFSRKKNLSEHMKIHNNDKRWSCAACQQSFVQKCSLKSHIRVHHGDSDPEPLIVYKKVVINA